MFTICLLHIIAHTPCLFKLVPQNLTPSRARVRAPCRYSPLILHSNRYERLLGGAVLRAVSSWQTVLGNPRHDHHTPTISSSTGSLSLDKTKQAIIHVRINALLSAFHYVTQIQVVRGHQARVRFDEHLQTYRKACTIQRCARRRAARFELQQRVDRR